MAIQILAFLPLASAQQHAQGCTAVHSHLASAQKALAAGDAETALATLNRAIEVAPNCADAFLLLGLTEFQRGDATKSIQDYKQALTINPRSYSGHYDLALAYLKENNLDNARKELEQAVTLDPKQADAAYDLGMVLLQFQQPAAALGYLRRARALNPDRQDVVFNIIRAELENGNAGEARTAAQDEGEHLGSNFQWNVAIGQLFLKNAQPSDAALYLRAANVIRPADEDVRNQLAAAYLAARQPENVLDLIKDPKSAEDYYWRGNAFYQAHRFENADAESDAAVTLAPNNPKIIVLRVRLLQRAGEQNAALEMAQKAISLAPRWDEPLYLAGISYYFLRHYTQARQSLAHALELNPTSAPATFVESLAWAGEGNYQESERSLWRAIKLEPNNARFRCHMGILLMRQNRYAEAEEFFTKAIQLKPEYALSHYELGKLRVQSKQLRGAAEEFQKAITLDTGLASAYYQLGLVDAKLGEKEESARMMAEFQKLHQKEMDELDRDAQAESDAQ